MRGLFGAIIDGFERKAEITYGDLNKLWLEHFSFAASRSGVAVNVDSALRVSVALACGRVLAEGIAQLPLKLYAVDEAADSRTPAKSHPAYGLLYRRPNEWMTSFEWRETSMLHAVFCRGGYSLINRVNGEVDELIPLLPDRVQPRLSDAGELVYRITTSNGQVIEVPRSEMFHIRGPSWDGFCGLDTIKLAREALGLAIATEETQALLSANAARPGGILKVEGKLDDVAKETLRRDFEAKYQGVQNFFRTVVTDVGSTWTPMEMMTGVDAQYLETRKFQIEEVCRFMRVFPQMVGYADKTATFASAEQFFIAHVIHTLMPWVTRWEQAIERDILNGETGITAKMSVRHLLRGDAKSQADFYASGIVNGWLVRNEARRFEELDPLDGLDEPLVPLNMGTQAERDALKANTRVR